MATKSIETLEKEHGLLITSEFDLNQKMSDEDFTEMISNERVQFVGVNHESRASFLKNNGHKVTRENMLDTTLAPKPPEPEADNQPEESA